MVRFENKIMDTHTHRNANAYSYFEMGFYGFISSANSHCLVITHQFNFCTHSLVYHAEAHPHIVTSQSQRQRQRQKLTMDYSANEKNKYMLRHQKDTNRMKSKRCKEKQKKKPRIVFPFLSINPIIVSTHSVICFPLEMTTTTFKLQYLVEHFKCWRKFSMSQQKIQCKKIIQHIQRTQWWESFIWFVWHSHSENMCVGIWMANGSTNKNGFFVSKLMTKVSFIRWDFFRPAAIFVTWNYVCNRR